MLKSFRKTENSKLATKALLVLVIIAFVFAGINDIFRHHPKKYVFKVGNYECSEAEWTSNLNNQLAYITQNIGRPLSKEEIVQSGIYKSVLDRMIDRRLVLLEAKKIGMIISDDMVTQAIKSYPPFQKEGEFDRKTFEEFIAQQNVDENRFVNVIRDELVFETMVNAFSANTIIAPQEVRQLIIASKMNKEITLYKVDKKDYIGKEAPTDEQLNEVLSRNKDQFMTPEKRTVSYVTFSPKDIINESPEIKEEELQSSYEQRKFMFERPERRIVHQVIAKNKEMAEKARADLIAGKSFVKVMKAYSDKQTEYKMPELTKTSLSAELGEVIFSLKLKEYSQPVRTPVGYHIFMVEKINPADVVPYEQVKDALFKQLQEEKEFEQFSAFVRTLDAEVAAGDDLAKITSKYNFKQGSTTLMSNAVANGTFETSDNFMHAVFDGNLNQLSPVIPADEKTYFVLKVDSIEPSVQKEFSTIKSDLVKLWQEETVNHKILMGAEEIKEQLKKGEKSTKVYTTSSMKLDNNYKGDLPDILLREIAELNKNDFSPVVINSQGNAVFIKMGETTYPDKDGSIDLKKLARPDRSQGNVIVEQYVQHLRNKYPVDINSEYLS
jgi:peptidyl-prolyl cis-trans isomerase D